MTSLRLLLRRLTAALLLVLLLAAPVRAAVFDTGEVSVVWPDSYTLLTPDTVDGQTALLAERGRTPDEMRALFAEGCLCVALPGDRSFEISLSRVSDAFTRGVGNLAERTLDEQDAVRDALLADRIAAGQEIRTVDHAGAVFFRVSDREEPSSEAPAETLGRGERSVTYLTVAGGSLIVLTLSDPTGRLASGTLEQFEGVFASLRVPVTRLELSSETDRLIVLRVGLILLSVAALAVTAWLIVSLVRGVRRRRLETDWQRKRRPKPRR